MRSVQRGSSAGNSSCARHTKACRLVEYRPCEQVGFWQEPRTTLSPILAMHDAQPFPACYTPVASRQDQWQVGFFPRVGHQETNLQEAVEAPMFQSRHFPRSLPPLRRRPNRLAAEPRIGDAICGALREGGRRLMMSRQERLLGRRTAVMQDIHVVRAAACLRFFRAYATGRSIMQPQASSAGCSVRHRRPAPPSRQVQGLQRAGRACAGRSFTVPLETPLEPLGPHAVTGVVVARSPYLLAGWITAVRRGAAFPPLSPSEPPQRLADALAASASAAVLTGAVAVLRDAPPACRVVTLEKIGPASVDPGPPHTDARAKACLLRTFGSTGTPKLVAVGSSRLNNDLRWAAEELLGGADAVPIEPEGIKRAASKAPGLTNAKAVLDRRVETLRLPLSYTGMADEAKVAELLCAWLSAATIPARVARVAGSPRTTTGKLNDAELPCGGWPHPDEDFFNAGGHSLSPARLVNQLRARSPRSISLCPVLRNPSVWTIATATRESAAASADGASRAP
jgi:hypothetical protein